MEIKCLTGASKKLDINSINFREVQGCEHIIN